MLVVDPAHREGRGADGSVPTLSPLSLSLCVSCGCTNEGGQLWRTEAGQVMLG